MHALRRVRGFAMPMNSRAHIDSRYAQTYADILDREFAEATVTTYGVCPSAVAIKCLGTSQSVGRIRAEAIVITMMQAPKPPSGFINGRP